VQGSSNPVEARKARKLRMTLKISGTAAYLLATGCASLWTLSTDKSKGPLVNGGNSEEVAIYLRNLGAVGICAAEIASTWMIRKRVQMLRIISGGGGDDSAVVYIIKKMDAEMKTYSIRIGVTGSILGVFCIPYLLPYQTYVIGIVLGIGFLVPPSKAFTTEKEKQAKGLPSVVENRPSTRSTTERSKQESVDRGRQHYAPKRDSASVNSAPHTKRDSKRDSIPSSASPSPVVSTAEPPPTETAITSATVAEQPAVVELQVVLAAVEVQVRGADPSPEPTVETQLVVSVAKEADPTTEHAAVSVSVGKDPQQNIGEENSPLEGAEYSPSQLEN